MIGPFAAVDGGSAARRAGGDKRNGPLRPSSEEDR
jgi:hypothetical protein